MAGVHCDKGAALQVARLGADLQHLGLRVIIEPLRALGRQGQVVDGNRDGDGPAPTARRAVASEPDRLGARVVALCPRYDHGRGLPAEVTVGRVDAGGEHARHLNLHRGLSLGGPE